MKQIILILLSVFLFSCTKTIKKNKYSVLHKKVQNIKDSISVGDMVIHNTFKHQILAHSENKFDSVYFLNKVYTPNKYAFDNCLAVIFGNKNGKMFKPNGIYKWNRNLLKKHDSLISLKLSVIDSVNINQLFTRHLTAVQQITNQKGKGKWMVYFGPKGFELFGGCNNNSMVLDMFGKSWNTKDIDVLFSHEIEHLIYEPIIKKDVNYSTGLGITMDEGLAQFYTYKYLNLTLEEALFGEDTALLIKREKEIFTKLEPYFFKNSEEGCPIFRHCERRNSCEAIINDLPEHLVGSICYFLGFRIIQKYEENNGKDSWKDIYKIPVSEFYTKSGYKEFINSIQ